MANNRIQIKRSPSTATPSTLQPGELAFSNVTGGSGVLFIGSTDGGTVVPIAGVRNPGTLTANQAIVVNSASGVDKIITANLTLSGASVTAINAVANLTTLGTPSNSELTTTWAIKTFVDAKIAQASNPQGTNGQFQYNDSGVLNGTNNMVFDKTTGQITVGNTTVNVQIGYTGYVNASSFRVGTNFIANTTQVTISGVPVSANGGVGSQGQILASNGATGSPYWTTAAVGTITGVTAGAGLTGGGASGSVTLDVGAGNGISISTDAVAVFANGSSGLVANATGVHIKTGSGLGFDVSGNLQVTGALSVSDVTVSGNLTVLGDLVSLNVATLAVEDSIITLAKDQSNTGSFTDAVDIGFFGTYGSTTNSFISGLFRDQSDSGLWKLFTSNGTYTNAAINTANTNAFKLATLQTFLTSSGLTTNVESVYVTANATVNVNISANVISLSGRANNDLLFSNGTGGITGLALGTSGYVVQSNGTAIVYDFLDGGTF